MGDRLYTSFDVEKKIVILQGELKLSTKAAVMRIAFSVSLLDCADPREKYQVVYKDLGQDKEYNKITILGKDEDLYFLSLRFLSRKNLTDDEIFPDLVYAHIVNGVNILYKYKQNKSKGDKDLQLVLVDVATEGKLDDLLR